MSKKKEKKPRARITDNKIQFHLDKQKMTQQELADRTEIPMSHLSIIIHNKRRQVSLPTALKIGAVLNVPLEELFTYEHSEAEKGIV